MVLTLRLIVLYGLFPCMTLTDWLCVTEVDCLLRPFIKQYNFVFERLIQDSSVDSTLIRWYTHRDRIIHPAYLLIHNPLLWLTDSHSIFRGGVRPFSVT